MTGPLRLEAQDTALSRRQHRFESGRGRHKNDNLDQTAETNVPDVSREQGKQIDPKPGMAQSKGRSKAVPTDVDDQRVVAFIDRDMRLILQSLPAEVKATRKSELAEALRAWGQYQVPA